MNHEEQIGQLELDAFRFATGEMGTDEQALFEDRLVDEPGVAGALSRVLELDGVLASIEPRPAHTQHVSSTPVRVPARQSPTNSLLPVCVALAACIALAVLIAPSPLPFDAASSKAVAQADSAEEHTETQGQPLELIENWLQVANVAQLDPLDDEPEALNDGPGDLVELAMLEPSEALTPESEDVVPDWLLDAVQQESTLEVGIE